MFHVKHSCVGASRSSFRVLHLVRRRRFAVPPPLRACSHWACRCSSGGRPWRWGERGTRGASVPVRSRGQRAMARGALDDGQPMRTSQSSSCGGGVAAWRCGGAAGQAPILSSGRPLSRPDRPRRSDWPDPIPSGYSFFLVSRFAGVGRSRRRARSFRALLGLAASRGALVACSVLPSAWVRPGRTDVSRETLVWI